MRAKDSKKLQAEKEEGEKKKILFEKKVMNKRDFLVHSMIGILTVYVALKWHKF